jgi:hypothetical protein
LFERQIGRIGPLEGSVQRRCFRAARRHRRAEPLPGEFGLHRGTSERLWLRFAVRVDEKALLFLEPCAEAFKYLMIIFRLVIIEPLPAVLRLLATGTAIATNRVLLCQTLPTIISSPTVRCLESCSPPHLRYYPSRPAFSVALRRRRRNFRADRSKLLFPRPRAAHWIPRFGSWSRASRRGLVFRLSS